MGKSAWEYTLEIISLASEIDELNSKLNETDNLSERESISSKIDALESRLFEVKDKLKTVNII
ncbi:hypothetical protein [uncultured Clostridium sp.]|uniref:hypothetical protein n=1 Tax=uncultured Clostridium sp. TaxID=59620 RepID=UPI0025FA4221|nr:hypothetical protein [uncultured Clostridium sp.]